MRGLFQGTSDSDFFPTWSGWLRLCDIFPHKLDKDAMIKELDDLLAYCNEGEKDSFGASTREEAFQTEKRLNFLLLKTAL